MQLIKVRGQLTLENSHQKITLTKSEFSQLTRIPVLPDEKTYYAEIEDNINAQVSLGLEPTTRQFLVQNSECISTIHFLLGRGEFNTMLVYMRSSDAKRLPSDIGFLSRMAVRFNVSLLQISIGSFHVILGE